MTKGKITREQMQMILDNRPQGVDGKALINKFVNNGYVVEGINDQPNLVQKVADTAIGGAANIANTMTNYAGAAIDQMTGMSGSKTFKESYDRLAKFSETDQNQNTGAQTLFGRDNISRDLSTAKGWEQLGGDALSTAATVMPAGKALEGAGWIAKAGQTAKLGTGIGAMSGAGTSMQEGNSLGEVAKDATVGAGVGAVLGGGLSVAGSGMEAGAKIVGKGANKVFGFVKDSTDNLKYNHIDGQVAESANNLYSRRIEPNKLYETYAKAQQLSSTNIKKPSALEMVGNDIGDAFDNVVAKRKEVGKQVGSELSKISKQKLDVSDVANTFSNKIRIELNKKQSKFSQSEADMLTRFSYELKSLGKTSSVEDMSNFITRMRSEIDVLKGKNGVIGTTNAERLISEATGELNNKINTSFPEYGAVKSEYSRLSDLLEEGVGYLGKKTLGGDYKKETSVVKSSLNSILNGGKKDFLLQLEKETGKPILDQAVIAAQAMKDLGDARGESLLQMMFDKGVPSKTGIVDGFINWGGKKIAKSLAGTEMERTADYLRKPSVNAEIVPMINKTNIIPPATSNISDIVQSSGYKVKSGFLTTSPIRELYPIEKEYANTVQNIINGKDEIGKIAEVPGFMSVDGKPRELLFSDKILSKITKDHGQFNPENLIINANDWKYAIKNVANDPDKINLILPTQGQGFLRIGANRNNGYYIVTHYENVEGQSQPLKNLLKKGDALDRLGRTLGSSSATSPSGAASQLEGNISGVKSVSDIITQSPAKVKQFMKEVINQLPASTRNVLIKELADLANEKIGG